MKPAQTDATTLTWLDAPEGVRPVAIPGDEDVDAALPEAGEEAARARWEEFLDRPVSRYGADRDRPDRPGTSRMSVHLKYGEVHPRTLLADLGSRRSESARTYRTELAWREFYADVLFHRPDSARRNYDRAFDAIPLASGRRAQTLFDAWRDGCTGYPIVDAGMRRLRQQAWMHNRVRMIVASFLVKTCTCRGGGAPGTSCGCSSTATSPPTSTAGSGRRAPAPTRPRSSGCSTRWCRGRGSIPTATTCAGSFRSCAA